ncbi:hypothetical protein L3V79_05395 [Thiotrichales bacterium 19S9-12]|nr:hypothetical protein [Thiotrichales bacterium 19S9-11]MCF6811793.1 hypothetical protein [Thiotrichales bacterium 19S9-12]
MPQIKLSENQSSILYTIFTFLTFYTLFGEKPNPDIFSSENLKSFLNENEQAATLTKKHIEQLDIPHPIDLESAVTTQIENIEIEEQDFNTLKNFFTKIKDAGIYTEFFKKSETGMFYMYMLDSFVKELNQSSTNNSQEAPHYFSIPAISDQSPSPEIR